MAAISLMMCSAYNPTGKELQYVGCGLIPLYYLTVVLHSRRWNPELGIDGHIGPPRYRVVIRCKVHTIETNLIVSSHVVSQGRRYVTWLLWLYVALWPLARRLKYSTHPSWVIHASYICISYLFFRALSVMSRVWHSLGRWMTHGTLRSTTPPASKLWSPHLSVLIYLWLRPSHSRSSHHLRTLLH